LQAQKTKIKQKCLNIWLW